MKELKEIEAFSSFFVRHLNGQAGFYPAQLLAGGIYAPAFTKFLTP
jgi:hypothetical protein